MPRSKVSDDVKSLFQVDYGITFSGTNCVVWFREGRVLSQKWFKSDSQKQSFREAMKWVWERYCANRPI